MDCFVLCPRDDGGPRLLSRRLSLPAERSNPVRGLPLSWIASCFAPAMTGAPAFCPAACQCERSNPVRGLPCLDCFVLCPCDDGGRRLLSRRLSMRAKQSTAWIALSWIASCFAPAMTGAPAFCPAVSLAERRWKCPGAFNTPQDIRSSAGMGSVLFLFPAASF
jgi:hypothetical protein